MRARTESTARTLLVAAAVALICSLLVSSAVFLLRPYQLAYSAIERNRAVLSALGAVSPQESIDAREVVARYVELERRIVDLQDGAFTAAVDVIGYDFREALQDIEKTEIIVEQNDIGGIGSRPRLMPVYLVVEAGELRRLVVPIYASGMWSTIYGYVALEADLSTIAGVSFYEHGETPGIGDRILDPLWLGSWSGKQIYAPDGRVRFVITANPQEAQPQHRVDSITGATVTVRAISDAVRYWFSDDAYGRFLERLAQEGL